MAPFGSGDRSEKNYGIRIRVLSATFLPDSTSALNDSTVKDQHSKEQHWAFDSGSDPELK